MKDKKDKVKRTSSQQLAQIEALNCEIRKFGQDINHSIAATITVILTPIILSFLFLREFSPFYESYMDHVEVKDKGTRRYDIRYHTKGTEGIKEFYKMHKEVLIILSQQQKVQIEYGIMDISSLLENFEILMQDPDYTYALSVLRDGLNKLFLKIVSANNPLTLKSIVENLTFSKLWQITEALMESRYPKKEDEYIKNLKTEVDVLFSNDFLFYKKLVASLALYYGCIQPRLNYFFPYGLYNYLICHKPPKMPSALFDKKAKVDKEARENYIIQLKQYHQSQLNTQKIATSFSFYISPIFLLAGIFFFNLSQQYPEAIVFATAFAASFLSMLQKQISDVYYNRKLNRQLLNAEKNLLKVLTKYANKPELKKGKTLNSSYFNIQFKSQKALSEKTLVQLFSHCCSINNLKINLWGAYLWIFADSLFDLAKLDAVTKLFELTIKRQVELEKLESQFKAITQELNKGLGSANIILIPSYDHAHLPYYNIEFSLYHFTPDQLAQLENQLKILFIKLNFSILKVEESQELQISLSGFQLLEQKTLDQTVALIKQCKMKQSIIDRSSNSFVMETSKEFERQNRHKREKYQPKDQEGVLSPVVKSFPRRIIEWGNGKYRYDSEAVQPSSIYPSPFGGYHSQASLAKARLFFLNGIDCKKIPTRDEGQREAIFKASQSLIENPHFVPKKGQQGFVFWHGEVNDLDGKPFKASVKGKFLGTSLGDVRLFGEAHQSAQGETLYVIKAVESHAH